MDFEDLARMALLVFVGLAFFAWLGHHSPDLLAHARVLLDHALTWIDGHVLS